MQYRLDKNGEPVSLLGYGCMRFTRKGGGIDMEKAEREIMAAYEKGVNYYDTAYIYPGSEVAIGEIFEKNGIREKIKIATKLPQYLIASVDTAEKYFKEELKRLRTDYVDFYLMHHMTDVAVMDKLKKMGMFEWLEEKKKAGAIRNIGFSYHGASDQFLKILNDYDWDMCQIQYNYFDEDTQAGVIGLKAAAEKGIPVVIMEPLRGGKLVNMLPEEARKAFASNPRNWSPAEWGFRWLYNQSEVTVVLSGMNSLDMLEENCRVASETQIGSLAPDDLAFLKNVSELIRAKDKVGCTGCRYCMPCPKGVDIPGTFRCYNAMFLESKSEGRHQFFQTVGLTKEPGFASQCIECGKCEQHCPQSLPIRRLLKEADKALRPWHQKIVIGVARKFMFRKPKEKTKKA